MPPYPGAFVIPRPHCSSKTKPLAGPLGDYDEFRGSPRILKTDNDWVEAVASPQCARGECPVGEIIAAGGAAVGCTESVAAPDGGEAIIQCALDNYGRIDILIHNAGNVRRRRSRRPSAWRVPRQVAGNPVVQVVKW